MKHKILMKLGVILIALASTASIGTTVTTNKAQAVAYKYNDKRLWLPKSAKLYVFHLKSDLNEYPLYDVDVDDNNNYNMILTITHILPAKKYGRNVIAPLSSKYDIKINGIKYRTFSDKRTTAHMPESTFKKIFIKGGTFNDHDEGNPDNCHMVNGRIYAGRKVLYTKYSFGANTPDKLAGYIGYKNRQYYEEDMALNQLDGDGVSVSDPDAASKRVINRVVKALKSWGYSDDKIQRILNRKKMCETYEDTHDDYDVPDFTQKWMYQY